MTFGTVCDGIGCGHLAFNRAGFECVWSAEIEPFPCAVLAYRFPDVRNHGDMNLTAGLVERGEIAAPDVFIGGTPCQAFSVAGKRKGLSDARGNLSLTFCGIADAVDDVRGRDGKPPCVILWENVPGVLSDSGNAFGCFLGELAGSGCQLQPPGDGWGNAGCVFGPKRTVAWRVLDSQFFGVAQRRRRVFVVASAGDRCRPEEILFERDGVRRDTAPSREAGKGTSADAGIGAKVGHWDGGDCHPSLTQSYNTGGIGASNQELFSQRGSGLVPDICGCLSDVAHNGGGQMAVAFERRFVRTSGGQPTIDLQPCLRADANTGDGAPCVAYGFTTKESGKDAAADIIPPLRAESGDPHMGGRMAVAFGGDIARTLSAPHDSSPCVDRGMDVVATGMQVRRLTPCECEALQGLPRNWTLIPWRGKPASECPDGPRYKGIGNGQTVNVMRWLAGRVMNALERTEP